MRTKSAPSLVVVLLSTCIPLFAQQYTISTVAGTDRLLDGHQASTAPLRDPIATAVDNVGNLYVADAADNRIRKVDTLGVISTFAGTGVPGYNGDRLKAVDAELNNPMAIVFDDSGNLYVSDSGNSRIRVISPDGTINTVAGNGSPGTLGDNGPALQAQLNPVAIAVDKQGNLFISTLDSRIRKVDATGIITTICGTGQPAYGGDNAPAINASISLVVAMIADSKGNLYLADYYNAIVRVIDSKGIIHPVAGAGQIGFPFDEIPALAALLVPSGLALDKTENNLFVSDADVYFTEVRTVDLSTGIIHALAGNGNIGFMGDNGPPLSAEFYLPAGLARSGNDIYVADRRNQRVRKIALRTVTTVAGTSTGDGAGATSAFLSGPQGVAVDAADNVLVADSGDRAARRFKLGGAINSFGQLQGYPSGVAVDAAGNFYVTDSEPLVLKITPAGVTSIVAGNGQDGYTGDGGPATKAMISGPTGVAVDAGGNVYFNDSNHNRIRMVSGATGVITTIGGTGNPQYSGDNGPAANAGMTPSDVAVDTHNNIYFTDFYNNRVRKIGPDGIVTTVAGTGVPGFSGDGGPAVAAKLTLPSGLALDSAGSLYIADGGNFVVRKVNTAGLITTIAGSGIPTPSTGDGGLASAAQLLPYNLGVDSQGRVFVSDPINDRVRMLTPLQAVPASMSIASGDKQSGTVGGPLDAPLVIKVADAAGNPIPGVVVNFEVKPDGAATVSPSPAVTLNDGTVNASVTLGGTAGSVKVTASASGLKDVVFSLTANPAVSPTAPFLSAGGIVSGGLSAQPITTVGVNGIATIFGAKFAPVGTAHQVSGEDLVDGKIPTNLLGVCAQFGTELAPILGVYPGQLNVQVPHVSPGEVQVQVITKCGTPQAETSNAQTVTVAAAQPEFFYFVHNTNGQDPIAAINATSKGNIGAAGLISGGSFTPAKRGDLLTLFGTGFGVTNPPFAPGVLPDKAAQVTAPFSISFGGVTLAPAEILYVGATQNAGLYQVNLQVPDGVKDGDQPLAITIGGVPSPPGSYITVKGAASSNVPAH